MFDKKKQTWFTKNFTIKKHVLEMKLKVSFSKHIFGKKYGKRIGFRTTHISNNFMPYKPQIPYVSQEKYTWVWHMRLSFVFFFFE